MRYRKLGRPGIKVSEIGFGGWGIGGGWGHQDDKEAMRVLKQALDLGITFLDTALAYGDGHSERLIGQAVAGMRDRVVIATKIPTKTYRWPILTHESSCILGIAIEEGKIPSADAKIVDYCPEAMDVPEGEGPKPGRYVFEKDRAITFRQLFPTLRRETNELQRTCVNSATSSGT